MAQVVGSQREARQRWASRAEVSGSVSLSSRDLQRMMRMQTHRASGRASALRVIPTSTTIFKTRIKPCGIAARACMKKVRCSTNNRTCFRYLRTSTAGKLSRIHSSDRRHLRLTENRTLKAGHCRRAASVRFPCAARRCNSTGLPEQMP